MGTRSVAVSVDLLRERLPTAWDLAPASVDLQLEWCAAARVHLRDIVQWSSHKWVFDPLHSLNDPRTIRAHVTFSRVCARVDDAVRH